jgi:hypothetical protein
MAKGQQRSNRETKKPKKDKAVSSAPAAATPGQPKGYVFAPGKKK